jgi:hypothetical protein
MSKLRNAIREQIKNVLSEGYGQDYQKHVGKTIADIRFDGGSPRDPYEYIHIQFEDGSTMNVSGKEIST